ncbi:MAG: hypothetical protein ACLSVD_08220 [Eggerthellaceae bacterium]
MCLALSTGTAWLGARCARGRVLYVNMEVDRASCLHRLEEVRAARGMGAEALDGTTRGTCAGGRMRRKNSSKSRDRASGSGYCAVIIDPLYKLLTETRTAPTTWPRSAACSTGPALRSAARSSAAITARRSQGWKAAADRASGSGVLARDADALLDLLELDVPDETRLACGMEGRSAVPAWRRERCGVSARPPLDAWFDYPLHNLVETGALAACRPK